MPSQLFWCICVAVLAIGGCANPLNRVTMDEYSARCATAERNGQFELAVEMCRRAWINTRTGALGAEEESRTLYNLGRVSKKALKLSEAEDALKQSLLLEEPISGRGSERAGRRLAELATVVAAQGRILDGVPYMEQLAAIAPKFQGQERTYVGGMFYVYADELRKLGQIDKAGQFESVAIALGVKRSDRPIG